MDGTLDTFHARGTVSFILLDIIMTVVGNVNAMDNGHNYCA
jgi:hypothetical protein